MLARQLGRCFGCGCALKVNGGEYQHRRRRGVVDEHTDCPCNALYLCTTDHQWAHAHPLEATMRGWIVSTSVSVPGEMAALMWTGDRMVLDCDGGMVIDNSNVSGT